MAKVYFRADASQRIGLGHITRSLALADMLKENHDVYFLTQSPTKEVLWQIQEVTDNIIQLSPSKDYLAEAQLIADKYLEGGEIVVLDGYAFQTEYQNIIKSKARKLVCIDDLHACHFVANAVINHAGGVKESDYSCEPYTKLYLGLKYALLRRPFIEASKQKREATKIESAFICFGGSDVANFTAKALEVCLKSQVFKEIYVVVGSAYRYIQSLRCLLDTCKNVFLYQDLSARDLCKVMQKCQFAIVSSSSIAIEAWAMNLEIVLIVLTAKNQEDIYRGFLGYPNFYAYRFSLPDEITIAKIVEKYRPSERIESIELQTENLISIF